MAQWTIDPAHTSIEFAVRHMMISTVRGSFSGVGGTVNFDPENPAVASVEAEIDAATIATGTQDRDNHLRSADFFDVENYPKLSFTSTKVEMTGEKTADITGNLTIHGTTRPVTLKAEFIGQVASPFGDQRAGFLATTQIDRETFGLTWNQALETGGVLVGKEIKISLDVQVVMVTEPASV